MALCKHGTVIGAECCWNCADEATEENLLQHITIITCACDHKMTFAFHMADEQIKAVQSGPCVSCTYPELFPAKESKMKGDKLSIVFVAAIAVFTASLVVVLLTI